ncbi:hypothetical protein VCUG_02660 [Vavraia culicis subsp. floridensis]|uniref:Uncharacterized protein n=1 Tax=Vavraia culicis (isolate floridensis) TaxID=948595 RepID=L2GQG5_VAVCU|nr:uncharacterized protein VCUG_02660 [Vavraia culicis subsp. floridensis]ELA45854.1 hypothetical protein VCUG_02660 [Vavraia culicis subsp. floridensis]
MHFLGYLLLTLNLCYVARGESRPASVAKGQTNLKERFKPYEQYAKNTTIVADNMLDICYKEVPTRNDARRATMAYFDIKTYLKGVKNTLTKLGHILKDMVESQHAKKTSNEAFEKAGTGEFQIISKESVISILKSTADILNALLKNDGALYFHQLYSYTNSCHEIFKEVTLDKFFKSVSFDVNEDKELTDKVQDLISTLHKDPPTLDTSIGEKCVLRFAEGLWTGYRRTVEVIARAIQRGSQQSDGGEAKEQANPEVDQIQPTQVEDFFKFIEFIIDLKAPNEPPALEKKENEILPEKRP